MSTKTTVYLGIFICSSIGGWLGSIIGHGLLSAWSLVGSVIGAFVGVWLGYKLGSSF